MLHVTVCESDERIAEHLCALCRDCVQRTGLGPVDIATLSNALDLVQQLSADQTCDLLLCEVDLPGLSGIDAVREIREAGSSVPVVFVASHGQGAYDAFGVSAVGYLVVPVEAAGFNQAVEPVLRRRLRQRKAAISVKSRDGAYRVRFDNLLYAETSNHDQVLHLDDGSKVVTRSSSGALFERLQHDKRFFKAGSSYIVNLEFVESLRNRDAIMSNGDVLPIPARVRKSFEQALLDFEGV